MAGLDERQRKGISARELSIALHITGNAWIPITPPRPAETGLPVEKAKLVEPKHFLEPTAQRNPRLAGAYNQNGIVGVGILIVAIDDLNGVWKVRHGRMKKSRKG